MEHYYRIYIVFNDGKEVQLHCESKDDAIKAMMQLIGSPIVYSAILALYSNEYPTGSIIICSIRNNSSLRGRKM